VEQEKGDLGEDSPLPPPFPPDPPPFPPPFFGIFSPFPPSPGPLPLPISIRAGKGRPFRETVGKKGPPPFFFSDGNKKGTRCRLFSFESLFSLFPFARSVLYWGRKEVKTDRVSPPSPVLLPPNTPLPFPPPAKRRGKKTARRQFGPPPPFFFFLQPFPLLRDQLGGRFVFPPPPFFFQIFPFLSPPPPGKKKRRNLFLSFHPFNLFFQFQDDRQLRRDAHRPPLPSRAFFFFFSPPYCQTAGSDPGAGYKVENGPPPPPSPPFSLGPFFSPLWGLRHGRKRVKESTPNVLFLFSSIPLLPLVAGFFQGADQRMKSKKNGPLTFFFPFLPDPFPLVGWDSGGLGATGFPPPLPPPFSRSFSFFFRLP